MSTKPVTDTVIKFDYIVSGVKHSEPAAPVVSTDRQPGRGQMTLNLDKISRVDSPIGLGEVRRIFEVLHTLAPYEQRIRCDTVISEWFAAKTELATRTGVTDTDNYKVFTAVCDVYNAVLKRAEDERLVKKPVSIKKVFTAVDADAVGAWLDRGWVVKGFFADDYHALTEKGKQTNAPDRLQSVHDATKQRRFAKMNSMASYTLFGLVAVIEEVDITDTVFAAPLSTAKK